MPFAGGDWQEELDAPGHARSGIELGTQRAPVCLALPPLLAAFFRHAGWPSPYSYPHPLARPLPMLVLLHPYNWSTLVSILRYSTRFCSTNSAFPAQSESSPGTVLSPTCNSLPGLAPSCPALSGLGLPSLPFPPRYSRPRAV